jgi:hypothetical protein
VLIARNWHRVFSPLHSCTGYSKNGIGATFNQGYINIWCSLKRLRKLQYFSLEGRCSHLATEPISFGRQLERCRLQRGLFAVTGGDTTGSTTTRRRQDEVQYSEPTGNEWVPNAQRVLISILRELDAALEVVSLGRGHAQTHFLLFSDIRSSQNAETKSTVHLARSDTLEFTGCLNPLR